MSKRHKYKDKGWFCYNGIGDPYQAASYRKVNCQATKLEGRYINLIYATGDFTPIAPLSFNVQQYISLALATSSAQPPFVNKHSKYFVYMKA